MILELRQYTLKPGRRDDLIALFDREFVESQDGVGAHVVGQFRDVDRPDRFVWLRAFADMATRLDALQRFYTGPSWRAHAAAANDTMLDSDDVLLLRPVGRGFGRLPQRPPLGDDVAGTTIIATICYGARPFTDEAAAGIEALGCFRSEYAENDFPALPVRTGEHVFVWFAREPDPCRGDALPGVVRSERLRLSPTDRSQLR